MRHFHHMEREHVHVIIDPQTPNWFAGDEKAWLLFEKWHAGHDATELMRCYQDTFNSNSAKAFIFVSDFMQKLERIGMLDRSSAPPYTGRADYLELDHLNELWIHTNNSCNLACAHCLVNSSPRENPGPATRVIQDWIRQGVELGVERFYFTGGEPFYRPDIVELIHTVIAECEKELIVLTNGTLLYDRILTAIREMPLQRFRLQISLDGVTEKTNDRIRGRDTYARCLAGIAEVAKIPIETTLTTVVHPANLHEIERLPAFAREIGVEAIHIMWPHLRGRFAREFEKNWQEGSLQDTVCRLLRNALREKVLFDNYESIKWRVNGKPGVKFDLSGAGWESLCIYSDGQVYPSASFANHPPLACGSLERSTLEEIWRLSPVLERLRQCSLVRNQEVTSDPLRFLLGGGDIEHAYFFNCNGRQEGFEGSDPYYPIYQTLAREAFFELATSRRDKPKSNNGFDGPRLYHAMGEGALACGSKGMAEGLDREVATLHSNCVLGFDVEKPRRAVQQFYGDAAAQPQPELCCPVSFDKNEITHIPREVIERFYGCGSPVLDAQVQPGEVLMDLGSGAGIDCFIAARKVGPGGRVIGVDMTDRMLSVAVENKPIVAGNLGYDVVEFREGYLEKIPVDDGVVDVITSNCVVNLSPDKKSVFREMWRTLKNCGRLSFSDIVAGKQVPVHMRVNPILWGECLSGALTQEELLTFLEEAGFYGLHILKKTLWKEVEHIPFYSVTVRGYKYEKQAGCRFIGQRAVYLGPFKGVTDEEGHYFPRGVAVEICSDTYDKLSVGPLKPSFSLIDAKGGERTEGAPCCSSEAQCCY
jgi:MoaA/NifB/PqqE/SkfB family radical SAM enzyme/SAM-dependent methyltransferase